jgi:hypothetical protein
MKQLTFDGVNDLFQHSRWGAVTKDHAAYLDTLRLPVPRVYEKQIEMSTEMALRNERFIDQHGFSME